MVEGGLMGSSTRVAQSRLGPLGEAIYELVSQLGPGEQDAVLRRGGRGFLVRLGSDGMPEAALLFDPEQSGDRRLLRYRRLSAERLA